MHQGYDIVSVGHAPCDLIADVQDDSALLRHGLTKTACTVISKEQADQLARECSFLRAAGGSGANVASCVGRLGGRAGFLGRLADDPHGHFLLACFAESGVDCPLPLHPSLYGSDLVHVFITPDGERSFASYYGISQEITDQDLDPGILARTRIAHLEGYALNIPQGFALLSRAARLARAAGGRVSFSPNDTSILHKHTDHVQTLLQQVDILLLNETESCALTKKDSAIEAVHALKTRFSCGVVTMGAHGAFAFSEGKEIFVDTRPAGSELVNTNGAGDTFAGGFLYGLCLGLSPRRCTLLGHACAQVVLRVQGARQEKPLHHLLARLL